MKVALEPVFALMCLALIGGCSESEDTLELLPVSDMFPEGQEPVVVGDAFDRFVADVFGNADRSKLEAYVVAGQSHDCFLIVERGNSHSQGISDAPGDHIYCYEKQTGEFSFKL